MCFTGGNIKGCSHCRKHCNGSSKGKKNKTVTIWSSNFTSRYTNKSIKRRNLNRYLYTYVHSNCVHNIQKGKTNLMSIKGWVDKRKATYHTMDSKSESCSVVSDSLQPHGLLRPWNSPGHNTKWPLKRVSHRKNHRLLRAHKAAGCGGSTSYMILLRSLNNTMDYVLFLPSFYRWWNWGSERLWKVP